MPASPVAHADGGPSISASWGDAGRNVTGQGFTPDGSVLIQVDGGDISTVGGTLLETVTANPVAIYCPPTSGCAPTVSGAISDTLSLDGSYDHTVSAYDYVTGRWSNAVEE